MKTCSRCRHEKPHSSFNKARRNRDGLSYYCKECSRAMEKNRLDNMSDEEKKCYREKSNKAKRKWRSKPDSREKERKYWAKYRKEYMKKYMQTDSGRNLVYEQNRRQRAKRRNSETKRVLTKDIKRILGSPCSNCGSKENIHIDHIIPLSRGGRHSVGNLQALCAYCNISKGSKLGVEWRAAIVLGHGRR